MNSQSRFEYFLSLLVSIVMNHVLEYRSCRLFATETFMVIPLQNMNCYWNLVYTLLNCTLPRLQFFNEVEDGLILTRFFLVVKMDVHSTIKSLQFTV